MSIKNRKLTYSLAINEGLKQLMEQDDSVFIIGQGVKSPWYVGNTCKDLIKLYGEERVIDTPISENAMTGAALGASLAGMKAVVMHPRTDFAMYAFDPIINQAANWFYMNGGRASAPVVFWLVVNRGGEQAAQHSQALHSIFAHIPGLKVVAPSNAHDAKGLMIAAINDPDPVVFIDDRWLYGHEGIVPEEIIEVEIGKATVRKPGNDVTVVASSYMVHESESAIRNLEGGISVELIDLRSIKPLDIDTIIQSVKKTGRLIIVDGAWETGGFASDISARINERCFGSLKAPVSRICLPDTPAPASRSLEATYYIKTERITEEIRKIIKY